MLAAAPAHGVLLRMLMNLRGSYIRRGDSESHLRVMSRMLLLRSKEPALLVERAHLRYETLDTDGARQDLEAAMVLLPASMDKTPVAAQAKRLKQKIDDDARYQQ
jgi:regulator of sirC expression with transglutaminase-like and TPR domain